MKLHMLKTIQPFFGAVASGAKTFEVRRNDRDVRIGDVLVLQEFDPKKGYSGRICAVVVNYIVQGGQFGIEEGYCVLGIERIAEERSDD